MGEGYYPIVLVKDMPCNGEIALGIYQDDKAGFAFADGDNYSIMDLNNAGYEFQLFTFEAAGMKLAMSSGLANASQSGANVE